MDKRKPLMEEEMDESPEVEQGEPMEHDAAEGEGGEVDPRMVEVFQLTLARVREALAQVGPDLDAALKADPVAGMVEFGVQAVRQVVMAAQKAGRNLPFEVILAVGVAAIKDLAEIANDKGYLSDDELEVALKEAFQQSIAKYAQQDMDEGMISPEDMQAVQSKMGQQAAGPGVLAQEGA